MFFASCAHRFSVFGITIICVSFFNPCLVCAEVASFITGECVCDSSLDQTICNYTVFSGSPALSRFVLPMCAECEGRFKVSSPFFTFQEPQTYNDRDLGQVYGIMSDQRMNEKQVAGFTVTYDCICSTGVTTVRAVRVDNSSSELFTVPGATKCPPRYCVKVSLEGSESGFRVKKPGVFAAPLATMLVKSNVAAKIKFCSFGNLTPVAGGGTESISMRYATAPVGQTEPPAAFMDSCHFKNHQLFVPRNVQFQFSLWARIEVTNEIPACEYSHDAVIQLTLENFSTNDDVHYNEDVNY
jgi:hypothetical protein